MDAYYIEIHVSDNGCRVSVEPEQEDMQEDQAAGGTEPQGATVSSIDDALEQARAIFKNNGQMPNDAGDQSSFEQDFGESGDTGRGGALPQERFA